MSPEWYIWYGLRVGLSYDQANDIPFGELLDYVAIEQVKHEGAKLKKTWEEPEDEFFALLTRR